MNPIFLEIGSFKIHYYGLMYAIAFFIGTDLAKRQGKKYNLSSDTIDNYAFVAMLSGLLGGRLYYVFFNSNFYFSNPSQILAVWNGGMAIHGGIIGGIVGTIVFSKLKKISALSLLDCSAPSLLLGQAIGRIGNLMNGEVHGVPTFTPWNIIFSVKPKFSQWYDYYNSLSLTEKMNFPELVPFGITFPESSPAGNEFPNLSLHPAMMYESILNLIGFLLLWFVFRKKNYASGTLSCIYIIIYSLIRIFVSFFRAEDLMLYGIRAPHFTSILMAIIAIVLIFTLNTKRKIS